MNNIELKVKKIADIFDGEIIGNNKITIKGVGSIENAKKGDITFLSNNKYLDYLEKTKASVVIVDKSIDIPKNNKSTIIKVKNAYTSFALLLSQLDKNKVANKKGIENPSFINSESKIKKNCYIGAFTYIDKNVILNENINIVVQINGKKRGIINLTSEISESELIIKIKNNPLINKFINNEELKKTIYIKNKLINLII